MLKVYVPETVQQLKQIYGAFIYDHRQSIYEHLLLLAERLWKAFQAGNPVVYAVINNYHPDFLGANIEQIDATDWSLADFKDLSAIEHGFQNAQDASLKGTVHLHASFEQAVDAIIRGDLAILKLIIDHEPTLVKQTSQYGHRATLLHYAGSNGIEFYRQQVPLNLPEIIQYLLAKGADPKATMDVYGGKFTVKALIATSAHPRAAGLQEQLLALF